jgi:LacI family transcriptional regulator
MSFLPQRQTLVAQLVTLLQREVAAGTWHDWLPNERRLSDTFQVSRNTLRRALRELERVGVIETKHGAGNRIVKAPANRARHGARVRDVAILSPEPIERLRPSFTLWIDQLRAVCAARGYRLQVLHSRQLGRANPSQGLQKVIRQHPHGCWILILASKAAQRWFETNRIPCVVAGTVHVGIDLPYCAQDHRVMARDAARRFAAAGHRRIAILTRRTGLAADSESEAGFVEGASKSDALIMRHDDTVAGVRQQVRALMAQVPRPTGLLVTNAHYHLTVSTCLQQLGWRVPRDVSLISRTDDPFLNYLSPTAARYATRPREMAAGLLSLVEPFLAGTAPTPRTVHIPPRFIAGESLGPAP